MAATIESGTLLARWLPGGAAAPARAGRRVQAFGVVAIFALVGLAVMAASGRCRAASRSSSSGSARSCRSSWSTGSWMGRTSSRSADLAPGVDPADRGRRGDPERSRAGAADDAVLGLVAIVVLASVPGTVATVRLVGDAWEPGRAGGRVFDAAAWDPIFSDLTGRVRADGHHVAISYDAYEAWIWSFSGAQVPSLWLPGPSSSASTRPG